MTKIRKGQYQGELSRAQFAAHFNRSFFDPAFDAERAAIKRLEDIAWDGYCNARKAPRTGKAGPGYADPGCDLSDEWRATRDALAKLEARQKKRSTPSRVLVICGSARNDGTCPGEVSKTWRLSQLAIETLQAGGIVTDLLDLSLLASEYGRKIHPCKACVSTAMPLCHWPCSCYPNHSLGQADDWMAEIYKLWVAAHGVIIVAPVNWYQAPGPLKLMIDRLVCADGGNPDPTTTSGKDPRKAKALELKGWHYPRHLKGRVYGLVVHGDTEGAEHLLHSLSDWLDSMELVPAGGQSRLERYIGYYKPYATSHDELDRDQDLQEEVRNVARSVTEAVKELRADRLSVPDRRLRQPRPK